MALIGGRAAQLLLKCVSTNRSSKCIKDAAPAANRTSELLGPPFIESIQNKTVLDFGCGYGLECVDMAKLGAREVIGLDIRESVLAKARDLATAEGVATKCHFTTSCETKVDVILSIDAFEHFEDPGRMLNVMAGLLKPTGSVWITFGPTWYHPRGGHFFSVFPWSHLVLTEPSLIKWRAQFKDDGATCFGEVEGGLNRMTISRFEQLVDESPFRFEWCRLVPIRACRLLWGRWSREFFTSIVQCKLVLRGTQDTKKPA